MVTPDDVARAITNQTVLVSVMTANNEVGTIQPIAEIAQVCRERGITFHTDAVQAAGKLRVDVKQLDVDLLSLSAHKFHGPKGVGALYVRKGIKVYPLLHGGHQEWGRRAATENVAGIVGLSKAIELRLGEMEAEAQRLHWNLRTCCWRWECIPPWRRVPFASAWGGRTQRRTWTTL